ncbi:rCG50852 [Rattus norvegicus]|uniref:RCG50852 n=1 Tax=Rattus norvegicus TaxID=10116 RepID=A6KC26_RAT|nr:rCG50852 [Rattus norvegicus]
MIDSSPFGTIKPSEPFLRHALAIVHYRSIKQGTNAEGLVKSHSSWDLVACASLCFRSGFHLILESPVAICWSSAFWQAHTKGLLFTV